MNEVTTAQMKELERLADAAGLPYPCLLYTSIIEHAAGGDLDLRLWQQAPL